MADLDFITPQCIEREIEGIRLAISPLEIDMVPDVLRLLEPVFDELAIMFADGTADRLADGNAEPWDITRITKLIASGGKSVIDAVALLARCDRPWLGKLLPDRAAAIALDVFKVNADFFRQAIQRVRNSPESLAAVAGFMDRKAKATGG